MTDSFIPFFEGNGYPSRLVTSHRAALWPDLSGLRTEVVTVDGSPRLKFTPVHPYAVGVQVEGQAIPTEGLAFPSTSGEYRWTVQTVGPFGPLAGQPLNFRVN